MSRNTVEGRSAGPVRSVAEYPLSRGRLVVAIEGEPPGWVEPTLRKLGQMLQLPRDWDSYGARAVDPGCVWAAWQLLAAILPDDAPVPAVVPTGRGGVQVEWHTGGIDLEIEVAGPQQVAVSFEDASTGEAWDKDAAADRSELAACVARLSASNRSA